jgi:hypothetical protein
MKNKKQLKKDELITVIIITVPFILLIIATITIEVIRVLSFWKYLTH